MAFILVLLFVVVVGGLVINLERQSAAARKKRLLTELHRADGRVEGEHRKARRAMNDAAGQSWRNQFE